MFRLDNTVDTIGTGYMGEVEVPPALIVRRFGPPDRGGDEYKESGRYVFIDEVGEPFVVHDWKATSLWEEGYPTPEQFWAREKPEEFFISSRDRDVSEFSRWFLSRLGEQNG